MLNCQLKATWSVRKKAESHTVTNKNGMRLPPGVSQLCHKRLLTCSVLSLSVSSSQTSLKSSQIFRVGEACLLFSMAPNSLSISETHQGQSLNLSINLAVEFVLGLHSLTWICLDWQVRMSPPCS